MQTAQRQTQEALLHIVELDADMAETRAAVVHDTDPMHTMVFDSQGTLLNANKAALKSLHCHDSGELQSLHACCNFSTVLLVNLMPYDR